MYLLQFARAETIGKRIRAFREFLDMSQEELAAVSGVSWNTISRMEKIGNTKAGDKTVGLDNLMAICMAMGQSLNTDGEVVAAVVVGGKPLLAAFHAEMTNL